MRMGVDIGADPRFRTTGRYWDKQQTLSCGFGQLARRVVAFGCGDQIASWVDTICSSDHTLLKALTIMSVEQHLLFAVLAFEDELLDLQQFTSACRAWATDKSKSLADQLTERGWVTPEDRVFIEKKAARKLAKHQNDPRVTLNSVTRGDVCDALLTQVGDTDVQQSLSSWPSAAPVLIETIGQTLDESEQPKSRYTWINEVGTGGLGKVWLARDNNLSREVALKEIKPGSASSEAVRRLIKEAQITGQLQHPGIVPVYEINHEGRPFYTMKLVRGETLSKTIREHHERKQAGDDDPLSERRLIRIFLSVCDAIAYAHSRGVIHRDLKPENIVLGEFGEAIVLDWGLARQVNSDDEDSTPIVVTEDGWTEATQAGKRLGTPGYMSPEQAAGRVQHMDERTDIYGLGAILFEILTGQPPHQPDKSVYVGSRLTAMLHRIATGQTPHVREIDTTIPVELDAICAIAMARRHNVRFQTVTDFEAAMKEYSAHIESISLTELGEANLAKARGSDNYDDYARTMFQFEQAYEMWPVNETAKIGVSTARLAYAESALKKGDLDLCMSVLDPNDPTHRKLRKKSIEALSRKRRIEEEHSRLRRNKRHTFVLWIVSVIAVVMSTLFVVAVYAAFEATAQKAIAVEQEKIAKINEAEAIKQEGIVKEQTKIAQTNFEEAEKQRVTADGERMIADQMRIEAEKAKEAEAAQKLIAQKNFEEAKKLRLIAEEKDREAVKLSQQKAVVEEQLKIALKKIKDLEQKQ